MSKIHKYIYDVIQEVRYKVTYPVYRALQRSALLVLIVSFIFALFIGLADWSFQRMLFGLCDVF